MSTPVYALVGTEQFLQLEQLVAIRKSLPGAQQLEFDGERATLAEVLEEIRSYSMFGSGKLVIVRNGEDLISRFREPLEDYLAHPAESGTLVLRCDSLPKNQRIYKLIAKIGKIVDCEPPKAAGLSGWIVTRGKTLHGLSVEPRAASALAELVGADLGRIDNELAKLALQIENGKITEQAVMQSVSFQREQEMFVLTNEMAVGDVAAAIKRWRQLNQLDTSAEFRAVTWLTMWLEEFGRIIDGGDTSKLAWKYRERLPQVIRNAKALGAAGHAAAVARLAETDRRSKSGIGSAMENVEQFLLSFDFSK